MSEERRRRAHRRRRTEEIMGWVCVPLFVMLGWYAWRGWEEFVAERQPQFREAVMPANVTAVPLRP
jgi:hypothetical protein